MTTQEMHIEVQARYQQLNTARRRSLEPEEIDALLNDAVHWFISQKVTPATDGTPRFELKDSSEVATLLRTVTRPAYGLNGDFVTFLPGDCKFLLSDSSTSQYNCTGTSLQQTTFKTIYYSVLQLRPTKAGSNYYKTVTLSVDTAPVLNLEAELALRGMTYTGLSSKEESFKITAYLMEELLRRGYDAYFETCYDKVYPDSIIVVSPNSTPYSLVLNVDGEFTASDAKSMVVSIPNFSAPFLTKNSDNRMLKAPQVDHVQNNPYYNTHVEGPVSELIQGYILTHGLSSFIVKATNLRYLKNPQKISLILDRGCDLPESTHYRLVDMAVEITAGLRGRQDTGQIIETNKLKSKT